VRPDVNVAQVIQVVIGIAKTPANEPGQVEHLCASPWTLFAAQRRGGWQPGGYEQGRSPVPTNCPLKQVRPAGRAGRTLRTGRRRLCVAAATSYIGVSPSG
jgi:hypothetical protein